MTATITKHKGRPAMEKAMNIRMSESSYSTVIKVRHEMELKENRRVTDREALDKIVSAFYAE